MMKIYRTKEWENAYFTVEAAMVLPMVLGVIVLLIYLGFFQYDRCLMELDVGTLALRGCTLVEEDEEVLMQELSEHVDRLDTNKYLLWDRGEVDLCLEGGTIKVQQKGAFRAAGGQWSATATYENRRLDPVSFIRLYRRITGGE